MLFSSALDCLVYRLYQRFRALSRFASASAIVKWRRAYRALAATSRPPALAANTAYHISRAPA